MNFFYDLQFCELQCKTNTPLNSKEVKGDSLQLINALKSKRGVATLALYFLM